MLQEFVLSTAMYGSWSLYCCGGSGHGLQDLLTQIRMRNDEGTDVLSDLLMAPLAQQTLAQQTFIQLWQCMASFPNLNAAWVPDTVRWMLVYGSYCFLPHDVQQEIVAVAERFPEVEEALQPYVLPTSKPLMRFRAKAAFLRCMLRLDDPGYGTIVTAQEALLLRLRRQERSIPPRLSTKFACMVCDFL